jgi:hemoglobin-like flavoprotein
MPKRKIERDGLMALDVELLRKSFVFVVEREPEVASRFYDVLFSRYPEAKPLFNRHDRVRQERMLGEMLVAVIAHLEDTAWLESQLKGLGRRHGSYGVTPPMYGWVATCLLETLASVSGDAWTPELASAWEEAITAVASLMQAA